jgi:hypothetical protein
MGRGNVAGETVGSGPPVWEVRRRPGDPRVLVVFTRSVSRADGEASARAFVAAIGADHVDLILDLSGITSYDGYARRAWQDAVLPRRDQLRSLSVVSRSRLTRMGASVFALALGIEHHSLDDMPLDLRR